MIFFNPLFNVDYKCNKALQGVCTRRIYGLVGGWKHSALPRGVRIFNAVRPLWGITAYIAMPIYDTRFTA